MFDLKVFVLNFIFSLSLSLGVSAQAATPVDLQSIARPPQFVLISFDGSYSDQFWKESFNLAEKDNARFSYFVSGVYFVERKDSKLYKPPGHSVGASDIGFADNDLGDIQTRTENVWQAIKRNFDIASHVNGHFDGSGWTESQWASEFLQFESFVENVFSLYPALKESFADQWQKSLDQELKGFRAPLLAESEGLSKTLEKMKYTYDASKILNSQWPYQMNNGVWNIGLSEIELIGTNRRTIAMDYNVLYGQCNGKFNPKNGGECANLSPDILTRDLDQTYQSYIAAFLKSYYGNRAPISIGHHFSLFNRGIYWRALQKFTYSVCNLPEVKCITHSDLVEWMESQKQKFGPHFSSKLNLAHFDRGGVSSSVQQSFASLLPRSNLLDLQGLTSQIEMNAEEIFRQATSPEADEVQVQMLKGDLPEAHLHEHEKMNLKKHRIDLLHINRDIK